MRHSPYLRRTSWFAGFAVLLFMLTGGLWSVSQYANASTPAAGTGQEWKLVLEDNFDGSSLNTGLWNTCFWWYDRSTNGCAISGHNQLEWYRPQQVTVQGGYARLTADRQTVTGWNGSSNQTYNYVSGMLSTRAYAYAPNTTSNWQTTYGYFETRMRVPQGKGLWPAFWLLNSGNGRSEEIDISEILGHEPNKTYMTYHYGPDASTQETGSSYTGPDFSSDWHVFGVDWQPGKLDWYVDGVLRKSFSSAAVYGDVMYPLFNLGVGGDWPGNPDVTTAFPSYMDIDYFRVYKRQTAAVTNDNSQNNSGTGTSSSSSTASGGTTGGNSGASGGSGNTTNNNAAQSGDSSGNQEATTSTSSTLPPANETSSVAASQQRAKRLQASSVIAVVAGLLCTGFALVFGWRHRRYLENLVQEVEESLVHPHHHPW